MAAALQLFDFVVFGKSGLGKSSTCNVLIGAQGNRDCKDIVTVTPTEGIRDICVESTEKYFQTSDASESCTQKCKVLSNGPIRVLDVPGFADSGIDRPEVSVVEKNLALIRIVQRIQTELRLRFHRILYMLPERGPVRRADRYLQDELGLFYSYYGSCIFDNMIILATCDKSYQKVGISNDDMENTKRTVEKAIYSVWMKHRGTVNEGSDSPPICPPVIYLPLHVSPQRLLKLINDAPLPRYTTSVELAIVPNKCVKCGWSVTRVNGQPFNVTNDIETVTYSESVCHPEIVGKYAWWQKGLGGFGHIVTLGVPYMLLEQSWPGFTNSDEICINCREHPGHTRGCLTVNTMFSNTRNTCRVEHSNQV